MINKKTQNTLENFRIKLLTIVLFVTFSFSVFVVILSFLGLLPLGEIYEYTLSIYSILNLFAYFLLKKNKKYYFTSVNLSMFGSILTFSVLTATVLEDEFRMVWFFFTAFASFMFGGKKYGFIITTVIIISVSLLWFLIDINLSRVALFTFISSIIIFNIFLYFFLQKIENDEIALHDLINQEVEKREEQETILLKQYRMTNMGEMIDSIAHQWRQPLNQTNMIILSMEDSLDDKEFIEVSLGELTKLTAHMSQTINDFRHLLNDNKEKVSFKIDDVLTKVFALMKNNMKDITLVYDREKCHYTLKGYQNELIQVFIILFSNTIEAFVQKSIKNREIKINTYELNEDLVIEVIDNAGGIKKSNMKKIFDPYFTTKKEINGTGLGLYVAQIMIEENMQGKLEVENYKKGVKFKITLRNGGVNYDKRDIERL